MSTFVLPISDSNATLEMVGGKGMSLAKMVRSGLPVPGGFHITTEAYRCFVAENAIQPRILAALDSVASTSPNEMEDISQRIGQFFMTGAISPEIESAITTAYNTLAQKTTGEQASSAVAVRSSATAEDLPGASFAGQQETYLNIRGVSAVLEAVKKCWASLWTARAIAYRARQGIGPEAVALAVVVQELVFADAAGVLFTANPISGSRSEQMITATWGLGEALVGGLVTPDTLIVEKTAGKVLSRETGEKQVMTVREAEGTVERPVPAHLQKAPVLSDAQAAELAEVGRQIEDLYGIPMDIEWTLAGSAFAIVQARPITSLSETAQPGLPLQWERSNPKAILGRASFAEFFPDPVSPLFATLAVPIAADESQNLTRNYLGLKDLQVYDFEVVNGYMYLGSILTLKTIGPILAASVTQVKRLARLGKERWPVVRAMLRDVAQKWTPGSPRGLVAMPASQLLTGVREIFRATVAYYNVGQIYAIPMGSTSEQIFARFYNPLVRRKTDPEISTFLLGFDTLPLRAEKSLYNLAMWAKGQPALAEYLLDTAASDVCASLKLDLVPPPLAGEFAQCFSAHLAEFGHTIYDLDFAKPVPADAPEPLIDAIKTYLSGKGIDPHERQRAQIERREQAEQLILQRLDPLRRKYFLKLLKWTQSCAPDREDCIADLGLGYPALRALLGELGRRLAAGGAVAQPEDVYWLENQEVEAMAAALEKGEALPVLIDSVANRRAYWNRMRSITPPHTIPVKSWMSKMLAHDNPEGDTLKGYPASAGKVTARACLLRGPDDFAKMRPGDVIVAVTTTPAWTPLFAMASAVVTDIGGPLSHSSIVAREYGIPAVMATGVASKRIQHGQMITVDGSVGVVNLL